MTEAILFLTSNIVYRFALAIALFFFGLAISRKFDTIPIPMGRFFFGIVYVFVISMLNAGASLWSMISASNIDTASLVYLLLMVLLLVLNAFAARRRSIDADLPPGRPSFITRVFGVDSGRFRVGQARRAGSHEVAQAPSALLRGSCCRAMNGA